MPAVDLSGSEGTVRGAFDMATFDALANLPDTHWPAGADIRFRMSPANLRYLRDVLPAATWTDPAGRMLEIDALDIFARAGHRPPDESDFAYPFKTTPRAHQFRSFAFARFLKYFALFCDPGTGKTKMLLDIAAAKFEANEIDCLLIIAPNGVHSQWIIDQIPLHLPDVEYVAATFSNSRRRMADVMTPDAGRLRVLAVNVEALSRGNAINQVLEFVRSGRCMSTIDESTRIKNYRAKRTKNVMKIRDASVVRAILTGTPITKGVVDLYSQMQFLSPDILGFASFVAFRSRYCITAPAYRGAAMGVVKIIGHKNLAELTERIAPYCFRVLKSECLDLPPKVFERRYVELSDEQRRHYNELVLHFRTDLAEGSLTALNAAARTTRLQQILSGYLPRNDDESGDVNVIPQHRTQSLVDLLEDCGDEQAVVWIRFQHDADIVAAALSAAGISNVVCDGRADAAQRQARKVEFVSGRARVYIGNPAAVGTGTDGLQIAPVVANYSHTFNAEHRWQAEDRTHRDGMGDSVTYYDFVARNTVDELFLTNTGDKRTLAERIIDDPALLTTLET